MTFVINLNIFQWTGTIGDYEIGAKWQWKFNTSTISTHLLTASLLSLLFMFAIGLTFFGIQSSRLSQKQAELTNLSLAIIQIQTEVQMELKELKNLREEMNIALYSNADSSGDNGDIINNREKRSDYNKGSQNNNQRSKTSKKSKRKRDENSTTNNDVLSKHSSNTKHAPKGIFLLWFFSSQSFTSDNQVAFDLHIW